MAIAGITEILQCMQMQVLHPMQVSHLHKPETFITVIRQLNTIQLTTNALEPNCD